MTTPLDRYWLRLALEHRLEAALARRGLCRVRTPVMIAAPGTDVHLEPLAVEYRPAMAAAPAGGTYYLRTSPEFAMKELLSFGSGDIFQIGPAFRQGESSACHRPEFTLAEWYRVGWDYRPLMDEVEAVVRECLGGALSYQGRRYDLAAPFRRVCVAEAFGQAAGWDPTVGEWDEGKFFDLLVERVEPWLVEQGPVFLYDYPAAQAMLARRRADDPRLAERFELYLAGLELANGWSELTDAAEQRARFTADLEARRRLGKPAYPMPAALLAALARGIPACAGVALGVDRLAMLHLDCADIGPVLAAPPAVD